MIREASFVHYFARIVQNELRTDQADDRSLCVCKCFGMQGVPRSL